MPKNHLSSSPKGPNPCLFSPLPTAGQKGQAVIITAICAFILMGFAGLAVDAGYVYYRKAWLKSVADGVALAVANSRCLAVPSRIDPPGPAPEPDYDALARSFLSRSAPEAKLILKRSTGPWSVSVTLHIEVRAFFARLFGVPAWNVSAVSNAVAAKPEIIGFSDCATETGGLRPMGLIMSNLGMANLKAGDEIDLIFEGDGSAMPTAIAVNPNPSDIFQEIARASEWGFPMGICIDSKLRPISIHDSIVSEGLKKSIGRSIPVAVFRTAPAAGVATAPDGFVRITPMQSSGPNLRARIDRTIKARPRLEI